MHLAKPITSLLSKEYHHRQAALRPNCVQVKGGEGRGQANVRDRDQAGQQVETSPKLAPAALCPPPQTLIPTLLSTLFPPPAPSSPHPHARPQALLEGIAVCQPQPKLPPELIKYMGKTFSAWQVR